MEFEKWSVDGYTQARMKNSKAMYTAVNLFAGEILVYV